MIGTAKFTQSVSYSGLYAEGGVEGSFLGGIIAKGAMGVAGDPKGNLAFVFSYGGFADLLSSLGGPTTGEGMQKGDYAIGAPEFYKMASVSTYSTFRNSPVVYRDPNGRFAILIPIVYYGFVAIASGFLAWKAHRQFVKEGIVAPLRGTVEVGPIGYPEETPPAEPDPEAKPPNATPLILISTALTIFDILMNDKDQPSTQPDPSPQENNEEKVVPDPGHEELVIEIEEENKIDRDEPSEYWEYDSRSGRRWNMDPKSTVYESPYLVNKDNPIIYFDPKGDCPPHTDCSNPLGNMERIRRNRSSNLGPGNVRPSRFHAGHDLFAPIGTPVFSVMKGKVVFVGNDPKGYGDYVIVEHKYSFTTKHGGNFLERTTNYTYYSLYGHLSEVNVEKGQELVQGQQLGKTGNTGNGLSEDQKDEQHLHFEIGKKRSGGILSEKNLLDPNIGYKGVSFQSMDPSKYPGTTGIIKKAVNSATGKTETHHQEFVHPGVGEDKCVTCGTTQEAPVVDMEIGPKGGIILKGVPARK